jgi:anti-anti-sigma factor
MEISERRTADIVTLSPAGKLDTTTAKAFEEKILARIESGDRRFIIDLAQLDYISSAGLRVFVLAARRLDSANGKLVLCGFKKTIPYHTLNRPRDPVREVFDTAGFSSIFSIYGSHDDAIKDLQAKTTSVLNSSSDPPPRQLRRYSPKDPESVNKSVMLGNALSRWLPSLEAFRPGWILTTGSLIITTVLWIAGRFPDGIPPGFWPWRGLSQLTILWSVTLMAVAMLAVVRAHALEPVFGGLDRAVRFHRILGPSAILLLIAHVVFLALVEFESGTSIGNVFVPFWSEAARSIDILVFYLLLLLGGLAYDRRMSYERWLSVHRLTGLVFLGGAAHAAMEPGTIADFEPLRTWMVILILAGGAAWLYRVVLFNRLGPRYPYCLETVVSRGSDIIDLVMRPVDRRMMYEPGTFVFLRVPVMEGRQKELHPFSISSSPVDRDLRLSIRTVGDFTRRLPSLESGTGLEVYGPFGGFTSHRFAPFRRLVCIGAGIGITPFLGMLAFELNNRDFRRIWLYYVVRNEQDAVYDSEIRGNYLEAQSYLEAESYIDYALWATARRGRITAAQVAADIAPLKDYAVMLCGQQSFISDLARQFRALGVTRDRIITEELEFR